MKLFVDGYGVVAHGITRKLIENHNIKIENLLVNTYDISENLSYIDFLKSRGIIYRSLSYSNEDFLSDIESFGADIIISLYSRRIIPIRILGLAKFGSFNLHPSYLPYYRGCFSAPWAIINQEQMTGITIHEMVKKIDSGRILFQRKIPIDDNETGYSLWHKTASEFVQVFDDFFQQYTSGSIEPIAMNEGGTYYPRKLPFDGYIDKTWNEHKVSAFIRAMHYPPFKGALLRVGNRSFEVDSLDHYRRLINK